MLKESRSARLGLFLLVLEIEVGRDRVMRVVNLRDEIRDRQLQRVGEGATCLILRREPELGAEIVENVGDMRDDNLAVAQERGREGCLGRSAFEHRRHALY